MATIRPLRLVAATATAGLLALSCLAGTAAPATASGAASGASQEEPAPLRLGTASGPTRLSASSARAKRVAVTSSTKRISRRQLAANGIKITITGLKKRTKIRAAALPNRTDDPAVWSKAVRASASGKATLTMRYLGRREDPSGRYLERGRYAIWVLPPSHPAGYVFSSAFRVY